MDFFSSLNQVRKNSGQLDRWEQQQRDKDAQRKAYQAKHAPNKEEVEQAKELGETLMNVIDVMDDHSESIAENIETVTSPISTLTMLAGGGVTGFLSWNLGVKANKAEKKAIEEFDNSKEMRDLLKKLDEKAQIKLPNGEVKRDWISAREIRRSNGWAKRRREAITDVALRDEVMEMNKKWQKIQKPLWRKTKILAWATPVAALVGWFFGNIQATKLQVDSSRIARFQARRELNDPKAFVNYTPEQIARAKAELENHPERVKKKQKSNLKKGLFTSLRELLRDRDNYNQTAKLRDKKQRMVERQLTDAEIKQAKKDQEVIQRVVKTLNNEAEKNSEKMEVAANVIMNTFPVVGGAIGLVLNYGLYKSGLIKKWVGKFVDKNGSEEAKAAFKELAKLDKKDPKFNSAWKEFYYHLTGIPQTRKHVNEVWKKDAKNIDSKLEAKKAKGTSRDEMIKLLKQQFSGLMMSKKGKWVVGIASSLLAAFPSALIALKLQKHSARAGRFTAKRELEKDPTNFIGYSQEELNEVKEVKEEKSPASKIKEYALFIPNVLRDFYKYEKYQKNELKQKQALNAELKKLDVSDEQLRDAKNLQAKVFNTFEKVDDKSQSYSEATEAAIESTQPLVYMGGILAAASPFIYFGIQTARGKYTPAKITEKVTNFFATSSNVLKSKLFKKYLNTVEKHTAHVVNNTDTESSKLGVLLKDIDVLETPIADILTKGLRNSQECMSKTFREMDNWQQMSSVNKILDKVEKYVSVKSDISYDELSRMYRNCADDLDFDQWDVSNAIFDLVYNGEAKAVKKHSAELIAEAKKILGDEKCTQLNRYHASRNLETTFRELKTKLYDLEPDSRADVVELMTLNRYGIENMSTEDFNKAKKVLSEVLFNQEKADEVAKLLKEFRAFYADAMSGFAKFSEDAEMSKALEAIPNGKKLFDGLLDAAQKVEIPEKSGEELLEMMNDAVTKEAFLKFYDKLPSLSDFINGQNIPLRIKDLPELAEHVSNVARGVTSAGKAFDLVAPTDVANGRVMKMLQNLDFFNNPKAGIDRFAKYLEEASAEDYVKIVKHTPFGGWEKESVIKIVKNVAKIWDNIPKEESKRIMLAMVKQFNENPDKFMEAMKSGKIMKIFATPEIKSAIAAAGISWTAFTFVMTYMIESWLAEIQLRAGRLGVKTAMDDLQDYRYYANVIPEKGVVGSEPVKQVDVETADKKDLLAQYKK